MKAINIFVKLAAIAALALALVACETDPCGDSAERCLNGATCDGIDGACICATGYEGDSCSVVSRLKFLNNAATATYAAVETGSSSGSSTYALTIGPSSASIEKVLIGNAWGSFVNTVVATVSGSTITIARQQPDNDNYYIEGTGTISGSVITVSYKVTDETVPSAILTDNVTGTWTKQ